MKPQNLIFIGLGALLLGAAIMYKTKGWSVPDKAAPFLKDFQAATEKYHLPAFLLIRQAQQESGFDPHAINTSSGAQGILQIVPRWHPNVNPFNAPEAIDYAAQYMRYLYNKFGTWEEALQAYNWGEGNLAKFQAGKIQYMPDETKNYYTNIMKDVRNANRIPT